MSYSFSSVRSYPNPSEIKIKTIVQDPTCAYKERLERNAGYVRWSESARECYRLSDVGDDP